MAEPAIRRVGIRDVDFGNGVTVIEPVNLYGCKIGDGAFIFRAPIRSTRLMRHGGLVRAQSRWLRCTSTGSRATWTPSWRWRPSTG
jgi:hypothetical protein